MNISPQITVERELGQNDAGPVKLSARGVNVFYGEKQALFDVSLDMQEKAVTAFSGMSSDTSNRACFSP